MVRLRGKERDDDGMAGEGCLLEKAPLPRTPSPRKLLRWKEAKALDAAAGGAYAGG
jgi:hypothetical protein